MELRAEIKSLHQQFKTTTVYVTHDQIEAMTLADQIVVMKDGNIVQQGRPLEIYDAPANTFVARFIGSPPMNLLDGIVTPRGDRPGVTCGELWLPLPDKWRQAVPGSKVILGLRPHDFLQVDVSEQPPAQLRLIEITGDVSLLHLTWGGYRLHVQFSGRINAESGQPLWLAPNIAAIHLFDAASGQRLSEN
ncbi:MAG: ABC transporter, partial [Serratia inhibens]|uniref:ABC transporter ATP-binding protein n=1 Tax=Serratia inhibens TaxID=2338073 RepID=UPI003C7A37EF